MVDMLRFAREVFALAKVKLLRSEVCAESTSEVLTLPKWRQRDELLIKHIPIPRPLVLSGSESTYPLLHLTHLRGRGCKLGELDDMQHSVPMICNCCAIDDMPQQVADDIQGSALMWGR